MGWVVEGDARVGTDVRAGERHGREVALAFVERVVHVFREVGGSDEAW